jgi:hypothetical protein
MLMEVAMDKFKALVHYVIQKCDDPNRLGSVRLNKILWYSDVAAYLSTGAPVTGAQYVKKDYGPVPRSITRTLNELEAEKQISIKHPEEAFAPREFRSLAETDEGMFSDVERGMIDQILSDICTNHTASSISDLTHDVIWKAADEGEEIPLQAMLVSREGDYRVDVQEWANSVI